MCLSTELVMRETGFGRLPKGLEGPREMTPPHEERALGGLESFCTPLGLLRTIQLKPAGQQEEAHGMEK